MHCISMRDVGGSALCRYNDTADIAPPHLCSTPASSEAEALTAAVQAMGLAAQPPLVARIRV
jgi:hypothetical protein